jgi:hypothetical protein
MTYRRRVSGESITLDIDVRSVVLPGERRYQPRRLRRRTTANSHARFHTPATQANRVGGVGAVGFESRSGTGPAPSAATCPDLLSSAEMTLGDGSVSNQLVEKGANRCKAYQVASFVAEPRLVLQMPHHAQRPVADMRF